MRKIHLGQIGGLKVIIAPGTWIGSLLLWLVFGVGAWLWLDLSPLAAVLAGFVAMLAHWMAEIVHHLGHAVAARQTGYPMSGLYIGALFVLAAGLYPRDEPELPAEIHIRRALGGPAASLLLSLVAGLMAFVLRPAGGAPFWLALFVALESHLIFFWGALLPLGFNDGSTLLYWWPRRGQVPH